MARPDGIQFNRRMKRPGAGADAAPARFAAKPQTRADSTVNAGPEVTPRVNGHDPVFGIL
ncbi:hypothetical protein SAVIM40S_01410 [Streptomyces avidinii]